MCARNFDPPVSSKVSIVCGWRVGTPWRMREWSSQTWLSCRRKRRLPKSTLWLVQSSWGEGGGRCVRRPVSFGYVQIENTHDGKKANFPEGRLGLTTRYICYTKKSASPQRVSVSGILSTSQLYLKEFVREISKVWECRLPCPPPPYQGQCPTLWMSNLSHQSRPLLQ